MNNKISKVSVYVGCGDDRRDGFYHCDKRDIDGIDVVCNAWEVSKYFADVQEIYSRHMLEHLTTMEGDTALNDWFNALAIGGTVYIVVPNLDYHIHQWLTCEWNEDSLRDPTSAARHGFAGIYGWQRECNPAIAGYDNSYWDVHKSGFNEKRMRFLLARAGFVDINIEIKNNVHLVATAKKSMSKHERQITPILSNIRNDHLARYQFAADTLASVEGKVLDCACGIGYGSYLLANAVSKLNILAVDVDKAAINYGKDNYPHSRVEYHCQDARNLTIKSGLNGIVSFETIEHVSFADELLRHFYSLLNEGGTLIFSTPNQDTLPFDPNVYLHHIRHYTYQEIESLVLNAGFSIESVHSQSDENSALIEEGAHGKFLILTCRK